MAKEQIAGKGRQGRTWEPSPGNFYGSTVVRLRRTDPSAPTLSLVAGLALVEAIDVAVPGKPLILKWPNDVLLRGSKLAGILLERSGERVVVGFGVNLADAPQLPDRECASLEAVIRPEAFAPLIAASFARLLQSWRSSESAALIRAWEERAHPIGTPLNVHVSADERLRGYFAGLESDGAMRLSLDDGRVEIVRAGDVEL